MVVDETDLNNFILHSKKCFKNKRSKKSKINTLVKN